MRLYPYMHFYIYHITWLLLLRIVLIMSSCSFHYYPFLFLVLIFVNLCVRGLLYLIKFWHVRLIILSFWTFDWAKIRSHNFFLIRSFYLYFLMPSILYFDISWQRWRMNISILNTHTKTQTQTHVYMLRTNTINKYDTKTPNKQKTVVMLGYITRAIPKYIVYFSHWKQICPETFQ